jgi:hypothetical protein
MTGNLESFGSANKYNIIRDFEPLEGFDWTRKKLRYRGIFIKHWSGESMAPNVTSSLSHNTKANHHFLNVCSRSYANYNLRMIYYTIYYTIYTASCLESIRPRRRLSFRLCRNRALRPAVRWLAVLRPTVLRPILLGPAVLRPAKVVRAVALRVTELRFTAHEGGGDMSGPVKCNSSSVNTVNYTVCVATVVWVLLRGWIPFETLNYDKPVEYTTVM